MNWSSVKLIFLREVRDQLRDRRTLFMIAVVPLLLYPLMGMSMTQVVQFMREHPTKVLVIGQEALPASPSLLASAEDGSVEFSGELFESPADARLLVPTFASTETQWQGMTSEQLLAQAHDEVEQGRYEAALYFPPGFARSLEDGRSAASGRSSDVGRRESPDTNASDDDRGKYVIVHSTARKKSVVAYGRVSRLMTAWVERIGFATLAEHGISKEAIKPFLASSEDVASESGHSGAALWSTILPFLLLTWALTGAFYPAVDLCPGEKERGTLETLLSSPAERSEIVWGKLLTVMVFSMMTALLNLLSIGITARFVATNFPQIGPPPAWAPLWLLLALLPISALFSALCLALAAFARSSKEGQYYLVPLIVITMPLAVMPMAPGIELSLGNSLIPVTGVVLLLRTLLEGYYFQALIYTPPVVAVTLICCLYSIRWAIDQFNSEGVLFRESERLDLGLWIRQLRRDRGDTPSVAEAFACGLLILLIVFFLSLALGSEAAKYPVALMAVSQLVAIATPALFMTVMLTRSPRQTLQLHWPRWLALPMAVALAVGLHPIVNVLQAVVLKLYPINEEMAARLAELSAALQSNMSFLVIFAIVPAICEELAFRGFILSGFRHLGRKRHAILLSSIFFGLTHPVLQQSVIASLVGLFIGYLAVQTGSILPCVLFHMTHNALGLLTPQLFSRYPALAGLKNDVDGGGYVYHAGVVAFGGLITFAVLWWLRGLDYPRSTEERLRESIEQSAHATAG